MYNIIFSVQIYCIYWLSCVYVYLLISYINYSEAAALKKLNKEPKPNLDN